MPKEWVKTTVIKILNETNSTKRFWFKINDIEKFDFKPGQFVTLDLPIHEKPNKRWRSYSIASSPNNTNIFELVIVYLEGGAGTNYLFNEVKEGSEIILRGPQGVFVLPEVIEKDIYLICTGTGIAPFRSMVHHIFENNIPHKNVHLIFGCRKLEDALYEKEFFELMKKMPQFYFHPTYSRETNVAENQNTGYVHAIYERLIKESGNTEAKFYLCGWKNMIDDARQKIQAAGFDKKAIHFELYG